MLISAKTVEDIQRRPSNWGIMGVECALTIMWKIIWEIQYPYALSHLLTHRTFNLRVIFLLESLSAGIVNDFNNLDLCTPMSRVHWIAPSCQSYVQLKYNILDHIQPYGATIIMKSFKEMLHMWLVDLRTAAAAHYHLITSCRSDSRVWEVSGIVSHTSQTEGNQSMVDCYQGLLSGLQGSFISCWWMLWLDSLPCFSLFGR